jgi:hypothetical protein
MFLVPAWLALKRPQADVIHAVRLDVSWVLVWSALTLLIGYRFQVGGDWFTYEDHYLAAVDSSLDDAFTWGDPAYVLLNWISAYLGWGVYGTNLICGALFSAGLIAFCRSQPRPWLALAVAMPYLVIVVAMGYSRQGVAIGFAMFALLSLGKKDHAKFVLWIAFAALFHKSAVLLVPLAVLAATHSRWWTAFWVGAVGLLLYVLLMQEALDALADHYIGVEMQSQGAAIRVGMNAIPALAFLLFRKRLVSDPHERGLWTWLALLAIVFVVLLAVSPSSTAVDRVALYLIPLQLFVLSRLPDVMMRDQALASVFLVVLCSALIQFVWLNFSVHAGYWVPYRFYPLELLFS